MTTGASSVSFCRQVYDLYAASAELMKPRPQSSNLPRRASICPLCLSTIKNTACITKGLCILQSLHDGFTYHGICIQVNMYTSYEVPQIRYGEAKRVSIDAESWFGDYKEQWSTSSTTTEPQAEVRVTAYSTIEQVLIAETAEMGTPKCQTAIERGRGIYRRAQGLEDSVVKVLKETGVRGRRLVTHQQRA